MKIRSLLKSLLCCLGLLGGVVPAFAQVPPEFADPGRGFDILIQGERRAATVLEHPAFDPANARMRA